MPIRVVESFAVGLLPAVLLSVVLVLAMGPWLVFHALQGAALGRLSDLIVVLDGTPTRLEQAQRFRQRIRHHRSPCLNCCRATTL